MVNCNEMKDSITYAERNRANCAGRNKKQGTKRNVDQPDDDDDAVEDVVGVPDVAEQAEGQQHEAHLQDEHAGENDVADLQHVGQLLGLEREQNTSG